MGEGFGEGVFHSLGVVVVVVNQTKERPIRIPSRFNDRKRRRKGPYCVEFMAVSIGPASLDVCPCSLLHPGPAADIFVVV